MRRALIPAIAVMLASSAFADGVPQQPPGPRLVLHNGSVMQINDIGPHAISISYVQPRLGLGVLPGTVLLTAQWNGAILNGSAIVWATCALGQKFTWPYPVTGGIDQAGNLILQGPAPVIDPFICAQVSATFSSDNGRLVFTPLLQPPAR